MYAAEATDGFSHRTHRDMAKVAQSRRFLASCALRAGSALTLFEITAFSDEFNQRFANCKQEAKVRLRDDSEDIVLRDIAETTSDFIHTRKFARS